MIEAKVIKDSISPDGVRITTFLTRAPKFLDSEIEKHRMLSSNSSSDRAIPFRKMVDQDYFIPTDIRMNQAGMQGYKILPEEDADDFKLELHAMREEIIDFLLPFAEKVHKQHLNRYLLPFSYQSKIITATEYDNFFKLRTHPTADPAIRALALKMKAAMKESEPQPLQVGEWHLPFTDSTSIEDVVDSVAACARVSYNNHDGTKATREQNQYLFNQLVKRPFTDEKHGVVFKKNDPKHESCMEHLATPMRSIRDTWSDVGQTHMDKDGFLWSANFKGWCQYRKVYEDNQSK